MEDSVDQPSNDVVGVEGEVVTLHCTYDVTSSSQFYLFWYKFQANDVPRYVLQRYTFGDGDNSDVFKERFKAELNTTTKSVPLTVMDLQVSDSAVYYCALRPTVTVADHTVVQKHTPLFISVTSYCHTFCDAISVIN